MASEVLAEGRGAYGVSERANTTDADDEKQIELVKGFF